MESLHFSGISIYIYQTTHHDLAETNKFQLILCQVLVSLTSADGDDSEISHRLDWYLDTDFVEELAASISPRVVKWEYSEEE
jgi:hypothetical protein